MTHRSEFSRLLLILVALAAGLVGATGCRPGAKLHFETVIKRPRLDCHTEMDLLVVTGPDGVQEGEGKPCPGPPGRSWQKIAEIDYERYFVVVAYLGAKPTTGFEITIDRMTQVGRTVRVVVSTVDASGSLATQIVTAPAHAVMVERSELRRKGDLTFEMWEGEQLLLTRSYVVP